MVLKPMEITPNTSVIPLCTSTLDRYAVPVPVDQRVPLHLLYSGEYRLWLEGIGIVLFAVELP